MVDFLFGKDMKRFLILISPLCVVLFILMWISWGLKGALAFFGVVLFIVALIFGLAKWMEFVDKHIKN
jgi:hypothetical protein